MFNKCALCCVFALAAFATNSMGQQVINSSSTGIGNCDNLGSPNNPYTMSSCWRCYTALMGDCDIQCHEPLSRQACYNAANSALTFCLNRTIPAAPGNPVTPKPRNQGQAVIVGQDLNYSVQLQFPLESNEIQIFVNYGSKLVPIKAHIWPDMSGNVDITIDSDTVNFKAGELFGVVTASMTQKGEIVGACATAYQMFNKADINLDGSVDAFDLIEAYESSSIDLDQFLVDFVNAK